MSHDICFGAARGRGDCGICHTCGEKKTVFMNSYLNKYEKICETCTPIKEPVEIQEILEAIGRHRIIPNYTEEARL